MAEVPERKENQPSRRTSEEERPTQQNEVTEAGGEAAAPEAQDVVRQSTEMAVEGARAAGVAAGTMAPRTAVQASPADITDEIDKGGPAFGAFVKAVGLGVAEAQAKLDSTLVDTAKALSETQIDVIAVFEQQIDDNGQMTTGKIHKEKLPLVNYIMPTAYQWSRVYLSADMNMSEINATNGFNIQGGSTSFTAGASGGYGLFSGWNVKGDTRFTTGSYNQSGEFSRKDDTAQGKLHMEATLEPRDDIQLPRPFVLQKGPRLKITAGARQDIPGTGAPVPPATTVDPIGRRVTLTLELRGQNNTPLTGKQIEYRVNQPLINYETLTSGGVTDNNGRLEIELRREGAAFDKTRPPEPVTLTAWLGLVNEQVVVNL